MKRWNLEKAMKPNTLENKLKINVFGLLELSGELLSERLHGFLSRLEAILGVKNASFDGKGAVLGLPAAYWGCFLLVLAPARGPVPPWRVEAAVFGPQACPPGIYIYICIHTYTYVSSIQT